MGIHAAQTQSMGLPSGLAIDQDALQHFVPVGGCGTFSTCNGDRSSSTRTQSDAQSLTIEHTTGWLAGCVNFGALDPMVSPSPKTVGTLVLGSGEDKEAMTPFTAVGRVIKGWSTFHTVCCLDRSIDAG